MRDLTEALSNLIESNINYNSAYNDFVEGGGRDWGYHGQYESESLEWAIILVR